MRTNNWEYQSEVRVDVLAQERKVPRIAGIRATAVEKDECRLRVRLDSDRLGYREKLVEISN